MSKLLQKHTFSFSPQEDKNVGLMIDTHFMKSKEGKLIGNQMIFLKSKGLFNATVIALHGIQLNPRVLRELADQLAEIHSMAKEEITK